MSSPRGFLRRAPGVATGAALLALLLGARANAADPRPVRLVPADDPALASLLLLGAGADAPVLLFDPQDQAATTRFLAGATRPVDCTVRPGLAAASRAMIEDSAGSPCSVVDDLAALARRLWPSASRAVLVPAASYAWLLRGAALAGAGHAALVPVEANRPLDPALFDGWATDAVYVLPGAEAAVPPVLTSPRLVPLTTPDELTRELLARLPEPPHLVVVANPKDREGHFSPSSLSLLAPLVATTHRAPLILVDDPAPDAVEKAVTAVIDAHALQPTHVMLVGDELALRSHRVADPVLKAGGPLALGGATTVRVELFSEIQHGRPQAYAVGRLVAEDLAQGSALLARQLHGNGAAAGERVAFLSNADEVFSLGETISRTTVSELRNAGVAVKARYRAAVTPAAIQEALERADLLVWEGHARDLTLEERGGVTVARTPPLVVLQGCYTLDRSDPFILFERGTRAIVATSAAIYSASGSAFARAFLDALAYDGADLGTAVRNARNYLLAVTELKKRRGHSDWTKTYRAALAFALWGDPTARPRLSAAAGKLPPAVWRTAADTLELQVPTARLEAATVGRYRAQPVPRAMLSGLILREGAKPERVVKELFFTAVPAPRGVTAACPPAPGWEVVSLYAPRTGTLSVLARPPGDGLADAATPAGAFAMRLVSDAAACDAKAIASDQPR